MSLRERARPYMRYVKYATAFGTGCGVVAYGVESTRRSVAAVVRTSVLDREKKSAPEYIYIDGAAPVHSTTDDQRSGAGFFPPWKNLKHSVTWRLLWLCRHGNRDQRNLALLQLAAIKKGKEWEYRKLAQALDMETAVLLARTEGANVRYFLPPPMHIRRAALSDKYRAGRFRRLLLELRSEAPHSCTDYFLSKYFANVQELAMESDTIPAKPDSLSDRQLCLLSLDAVHHHLSTVDEPAPDRGRWLATRRRLVELAAELLATHPEDCDVELASVKLLGTLSAHRELSVHFYQNGMLAPLARWLRSPDVRLACTAAGALANLAGEGPVYRNRHVYLLHPIYRSREPVKCDVLFVHGLRGGVFVTWRQRDPKTESLLGIFGKRLQSAASGARTRGSGGGSDGSVRCDSSVKCDSSVAGSGKASRSEGSGIQTELSSETVLSNRAGGCNKYATHVAAAGGSGYLADPDLRQVIEEQQTVEEEGLLEEYEVITHDVPEAALRDTGRVPYTSPRKREALDREQQDFCCYTSCWPKDWLPRDCPNLRIVGVNYCSAVSEWAGGCEGRGRLAERARGLRAALRDAAVGGAPLVWLAHSCGGLIAECVLRESSESDSEEERRLALQTRALVFYSTPHRGSALATMPRATAAVLWPSTIVRELQVDAPELLQLNREFLAMAERHGWETLSFGEARPTLVSSFKVPIHFVQPRSADLGRGPFYQLPLDHLSICKPATRQSILYTSVVDILRRVTQEEEPRVARTSVLEVAWMRWISRFLPDPDTEKETPLATSGGARHWLQRALYDAFTDHAAD